MGVSAVFLKRHAIRLDRHLTTGEIEMSGRRPADPGAEAEVDIAKGTLVLNHPAGRHWNAGIKAHRHMGDAVHGVVRELIDPLLQKERLSGTFNIDDAPLAISNATVSFMMPTSEGG